MLPFSHHPSTGGRTIPTANITLTPTADARPETYRRAASLLRERPGPWEVAYDPPDGNPSDPSTKLCLIAAIQEACNPGVLGGAGEHGYDGAAFDRACAAFEDASGVRAYDFYRDHGADSAALVLDGIADRLEADRA